MQKGGKWHLLRVRPGPFSFRFNIWYLASGKTYPTKLNIHCIVGVHSKTIPYIFNIFFWSGFPISYLVMRVAWYLSVDLVRLLYDSRNQCIGRHRNHEQDNTFCYNDISCCWWLFTAKNNVPVRLRVRVHFIRSSPANTRRWPNDGLMLDQRRRRWANIHPTLGQRLVFAGPNVTPWNRVNSRPSGKRDIHKHVLINARYHISTTIMQI